MDQEFLYEDITKKIIRCFYNVYDELGIVNFGEKLEFKRRIF